MRDPEIEEEFPALRADGYAIASPETPTPNCIGWVLGDHGHFWDPQLVGFKGMYYWPPGIPRDDRLVTWIQLFGLFGYRECAGPGQEAGLEKIVIYADDSGDAQHVAKQLETGEWGSKLGSDKDISHATPEGLRGSRYGRPATFMSRQSGVVTSQENADG